MTQPKIIKAIGHGAKSFFGLDGGIGGVINTEVILPGQYRNSNSTPFGNQGWIFDAAGPGMDVFFSYNGLGDIVKAYEKCAPVYSIVNQQAYTFINGRTKYVDDPDKKNVIDNPSIKKLKALFKKPNALQNWKQFEAQLSIYTRLFGYCIILPIKPNGFTNDYATAIWIIPPFMCEFKFAEQSFYNLKKGFIVSITVTYGRETSNLNPDDVIIIKDVTPGMDNIVLPNSPIKPLQQNISNLISLYNSKGSLINYRGALGILSPEKDPTGNIPMEEWEKQEVQNELMRFGITSRQWKFIFSTSALKWQQIGVSYKDLMMTEWAQDDTMIICDGLSFPYKLLSNTGSSSMAGTEAEAWKKKLYQDFTIPFAEMIYEQLSDAFNTANNGFYIIKDYSHVTVLQDDKINSGRARLYLNQACVLEWERNMITANQWLELNQMPPLKDGTGDQYYYQWVDAGKKFPTPAPAVNADQQNAEQSNNNP